MEAESAFALGSGKQPARSVTGRQRHPREAQSANWGPHGSSARWGPSRAPGPPDRGAGRPWGERRDCGVREEPPGVAGPGPHLSDSGRVRRGDPGCSPRRGDREGPRVAAGMVTAAPRPLQLLIPSPSPVPEEDWAAAAASTASPRKACGRTSHPRRSNARVHLGFPVVPRAGVRLRQPRGEPRSGACAVAGRMRGAQVAGPLDLLCPKALWVKNPPTVQETQETGFDPWLGKIPWRRKWQPTPIFLPGKSRDRGVWQATGHGVAKSRMQLND